MGGHGRVLFLQHQADAPPGYLGERAAQRGHEVTIASVADGRVPDPAGFDLVVSLGSGASAYDETVPWIPTERSVLRRAVDSDVPVLGVCFGSQMLAGVLGGEVRRAPSPTIGWHMIDTDAPELFEPGPWVVWHFDVITPPPGATELARSPVGPQAFVAGPHAGVQFHPEATPESVASWASTYDDVVAALGRSTGELLAETRTRAGEARRAAHRLFDRLYERAQDLRSG